MHACIYYALQRITAHCLLTFIFIPICLSLFSSSLFKAMKRRVHSRVKSTASLTSWTLRAADTTRSSWTIKVSPPPKKKARPVFNNYATFSNLVSFECYNFTKSSIFY